MEFKTHLIMFEKLNNLLASANQVILGKNSSIRLSVCCLLAHGHLLIEDVPGVGKTTLSHTLAKLFGLEYQRIQFTSDILPADIIGSSVFLADKQQFKFHPGPIFKQIILADEINRASPKVQSALLEAMEERQVTVDGKTYPLPTTFFVIATQNPLFHAGTFALPESQMDRFLMRIALGYPDQRAERELLAGSPRHLLVDKLPVILPLDELMKIQKMVNQVYASPALLDYVLAVLTFTRQPDLYQCGLSPRAGLALLRAAKAWALMAERQAVLPEDIQAVLPAVAGHRLCPGQSDSISIVAPIINSVPV
jgi:MoxR-like ATPase